MTPNNVGNEDETEKIANGYFKQVYNKNISLESFISTVKGFKNSSGT